MNLPLSLALPLFSGLGISFLLEQTLTPKPSLPWQRPLAATSLHIGLWLASFTVLLLLFQRPWFAIANLAAFQGLLVMVNHAKYTTLRECFIFQDFEYFTDAIKHPRLYLPFFGVMRTIAATLAFVSAVALGIYLEPPLTGTLGTSAFVGLCASLALPSLATIGIGRWFCPKAHHQPNDDLQHLGQMASFWQYSRDEAATGLPTGQFPFDNLPVQPANLNRLPNIIAVQSESFFDPRPLYPQIKPMVLRHYDETKQEAVRYGRIRVPAWGANTVRTECGFLTALAPGQMGIHQFNPYRLLAKQGIANLAGYLKKLGYQTLCIHPYPASFYQRHLVYPKLGFDQFIDASAFSDGQKCGQYIGDLAVTDKIIDILDGNCGKPLFIFVITMENHGPLHLEQVGAEDAEKFFHQAPPTSSHDLTAYLRHLENADQMIKRLKDKLLEQHQQQNQTGALCWYGDHVPIMADIYQQLGEPDGLTDYLLWNTDGTSNTTATKQPQDLAIHELALQLLHHSLGVDPYPAKPAVS